MELRVLTNHLQDLCHQGLSHAEVILSVRGCTSELLGIQSNEKKGEPVILIGEQYAEDKSDEG